jgi:serine protease Do
LEAIVLRFHRWLSVLITTILLANGTAQSIPKEVRQDILKAVVQIIPFDDASGEMAPWSGSGTIISPDGYILTNFHVIGDIETRQHFNFHAILTTDPAFTDQPPTFSYWAEYVASDPTHDLAILKIVEFADETPVPASLPFVSVAVGDSNELFPGDLITIVGYPGISGSTVTFTAGLMSGWLGEDFEAGGKQWIKTDAKIAHGNSGGAAFNQKGELVGIPTAGITVKYDELDVEEQAYVRPISLAWALIGPNVANVSRSGSGSPSATTTPSTTGSPSGDPSGDYGSIDVGQVITGTIAGTVGEDDLVFHGYSLNVPPGTSQLNIEIIGEGEDLDLAVNIGTPIETYDEVDYLDITEEPNPRYQLVNPTPGTVYIDVLNLLTSPARYQLSVSSGSTAANPLAPQNPLTPQTPSGTITAGTTGSGTVSDQMQLGQNATGSLVGTSEGGSYHTYVVAVPGGTPRLTIRMNADVDMDLAVKYGSDINSWTDDGDWQYRDNSLEPKAEFMIVNPQEGPWFIDVINFLGPSVTGSYTLTVE